MGIEKGLEIKSILVDGTLDKQRYLVIINNTRVLLEGKSFAYFTKLAWSRSREEDGWVWKEDLEPGFNQARYLYRMKKEIAQEIGTSWQVVENNRLGYYRLNADRKIISFNEGILSCHENFDVRELFSSQVKS